MAIAKQMGWDNPFTQFVGNNRNTLMGFGAGLASGRNIGEGVAQGLQYGQQGKIADTLLATQETEKAKVAEQGNVTRSWLEQQGFTDLVPLVDAGQAGLAYGEALKRMQPQSADPFTLGAGQVRYDGSGNVIAQGPEGGPETVINNNMGGTDEFYSQLDKNLATQTTSTLEAGMNAQSNNIRLSELERVLQTAPQGAQGVMVQAAGAIGLPVQGLDDVQAAQALISQMVPGQRPAGSGTMSDADLALFKASLPSIINQPGGNQKILQTMKAVNEYTIEQARIAQMVANREISPADGRAMQAQVPNPLAGIRSGGAPAAPSGGQRLRFNPATGTFE